MDHIQDVYKKKPEMIEKIWEHLTKVNLKVDGKPFQVLYNDEEDELEFHGRSGNETKVGPLISDYERLFSKPINDAIAHIETRTDIFKKYKFLTFEVINEILLLTAIIKNNGEFVNSPAEIDKIAKELDTDVMPALWEGKISEEQKTTIMEVISTGIVPTGADFIKWVKDLFGSYAKFPKKLISATDEFIEGIVFFFNVDGKIVEYKLVDPSYRQSMKDRDEANKQEQEKNAKYYEEIYNFFLDWSDENAKGEDNNRIVSIQKNFLNMMSDPKIYSKLMNLGSKIKINDSKTYTIQPGRCCEEMKKAIKKHGAVYKNLFEKFIKLFYKGKKRGFVISKEFQDRVNKVVDKFADYSLNEDEVEVNGNILLEGTSTYGSYNFIIDRTTQFKDVTEDDVEKYRIKDKKDNRPQAYINLISKLCNNKNEDFLDFVERITNKWIADFDGSKRNIPFRFNQNENRVKLARCYHEFSAINKTKSFGKTVIEIGNGLGGGQGGNEFESNLAVGIFRYLLNSCELNSLVINDKDVKTCLTKIHNNDDSSDKDDIKCEFSKFHNVLKEKCLPAINNIVDKNKKYNDLPDDVLAIKLYGKNEDVTGLKQTGGSNTKRGISNIFDIDNDDFSKPSTIENELSNKNIDKKLKESGEIISDITIPAIEGEKTYNVFLSVKEDAAQLSGVVVSPSIRVNKEGNKYSYRWMDEYFNTDLPDHKKMAEAFFNIFGISAEELKTIYSTQVSEKNKGKKIPIKIGNYDGKLIGKTISRLIGGNYWYVSPSKCFFVSDNKKGFKWSLDTENGLSAYLSGTGRTLVINGKIGEIKCDIILRTANIKDNYPTRLFPKIKGTDLLKLMQK